MSIEDIYRAAVTGHADNLRDLAFGRMLRNRPTAAVKTASGTALVLTDSVGAQVQGLRVFGRSTQTTTTGKNLLKIDATAQTAQGITINVDTDGTVLANGTATATSAIMLGTIQLEKNTAYVLNGCPTGGGAYTFRLDLRYSSVQLYEPNVFDYGSSGVEFVPAEDTTVSVALRFFAGATMQNITFRPMIRKSEITDAAWEPYTNGIASPSPEYPQPITSAGDSGSITVGVNGRRLICSTPNGLPGVPVSSGGNYTDESGQPWICDEIDFGRGVYVQRCVEINSVDYTYGKSYSGSYMRYKFVTKNAMIGQNTKVGMCNAAQYRYDQVWSPHFYVDKKNVEVYVTTDYDIDTTPLIILCALQTPIETPLTAAELQQYRNLYTSAGGTTITNDADCYMSADYYGKI